MMSRIRSGDTERLQTPSIKDGSLAALTGLTTVVVAVQRTSDGQWLDWNDDTFKAAGWTTRQLQMTEVSATLAPGEYYADLDTSSITNPTADDVYMVRVDETGGTAKNVPLHGELKVDQWVADLFGEHTSTQADIAALNDPTAGAVADAVWDELTAGHVVGGSFGAEVQAKAEPGDAMDLVTDAVDADAMAATGVAEIQTGLATSLALAAVQSDTDDIQTRLPAALVGGRMDSDVAVVQPGTIDAAAIATGAVDADALAADAVTEIADGVWDEAAAGHVAGGSMGELQARLDVAVSTRSDHTPGDVDTTLTAAHGAGSWNGTTPAAVADAVWDEAQGDHVAVGSMGASLNDKAEPGDAMDLVADAVDSSSMATSGAQEVASEVDATLTAAHGAGSWAGATAPAVADAVWDEALSGHVGAGSAGQAQGRLDALVSSRTAPGDAMDLVTDALDSAAVAVSGATEVANAVDSTLTGTHGAGSWAGATAAAIADQVWDEAALDHVAGGSMGQLQGRLDATVSSRAAPGDAMDLVANSVDGDAVATSGADEIAAAAAAATDVALTAAHGVGAWTSASPPSAAAIADQVWDEAQGDHVVPGSMGAELASKTEPGDAMDLVTDALDAAAVEAGGATEIANAVEVVQAAVHGAGSWESASGPAASVIADAVWEEATAGHQAAGTFGRATNSIAVEGTVQAVPAPTSTTFPTDLTEADGFHALSTVIIVNAAGVVTRTVAAYLQADGLITVAALPFTPSSGDSVLVLRRLGGVTVEAEVVPSTTG